MNLMCPNCQKMLTVPEQYAGQLMKCPLCAGTFTVPGLPPSMPASAPAPPPPPAPDTYALHQEPAAPPPPAPPPPAPASRAPAPEPPLVEPIAPKQPAGTTSPGGYARTMTLTLNPVVIPWIAPVCLVLVLILSFFSWVGYYPGGYGVVTQNGLQFLSVDPVYARKVLALNSDTLPANAQPSTDILLIFFWLLFIPAMLLAVASVVVPMLKIQLPPVAQQLMPWRWGIAGAATILAFLFLLLQAMFGFSIESQSVEYLPNGEKIERKTSGTPEEQQAERFRIATALASRGVERTVVFSMVFWLMLFSSLGCATQYWLDQRERTKRPLPRVDLMW
jgi:hypothetical protein